MPKYSQIRAKDLVKLLLKNWFYKKKSSWSHLLLRNNITNKTTVIPIHNKPLWKGLLSAILKQAWFNKDLLEKEIIIKGDDEK